ncbi:RNA polymerase sigma factor [Chryseolinea soli]|uniref:Sigma-70 family RNA polymerase sigma factor n=1 Tax=Chryseolinea soli TaxID=2321403 RepID=A0A385SUC8_9BACT|nr:sigma-70 family RNA polymerase sigma factor [Chryseolinea soli]AYB33585.1 sigma-70 family RNA polymerase sigma factor [Chryseolinea soli]
MATSLEFYSGRVLPIVDSLLEVRKKLFGRRETVSAQQIYDRFVQELFSYGMQFSKDRDAVKEALVELFVQIKRRGQFYADRSIQVSLFTEFRKMLRQAISTSDLHVSGDEHLRQTFEPGVQQTIGKLTPLHQEVLFLILSCGFNNREVAGIMGVGIKTVSQWADEAMEYVSQQKMGSNVLKQK